MAKGHTEWAPSAQEGNVREVVAVMELALVRDTPFRSPFARSLTPPCI